MPIAIIILLILIVLPLFILLILPFILTPWLMVIEIIFPKLYKKIPAFLRFYIDGL